MRKAKKLELGKITISRLSRTESSVIYGGTLEGGCDPKSKNDPTQCPETATCDETVKGPQCN